MLKDNYTLDTTIELKDANGNPLVVGDTYEMFAPVAKDATKGLAIVWKDDVNFSFVYAGGAYLGQTWMVCTADISYGDSLGAPYRIGSENVRDKLGGVSPLCPRYVAAKFVRPVTNG